MSDRRASAAPAATSCAIAAHGLCEERLSGLAALRDRAAPAGAPALPPRFLRHCDEQTVVGLHAVLAAVAAAPTVAGDLARHGVVGAPCQAGRLVTARSLVQMRREGAVAISTHIVPQCSLHSLAGAVSVALGMHGPHLGVGGGGDALAEGLVTAVSLVQAAGSAAVLPAVWLVATEWDEEPALDESGAPTNDPLCRGLALLLDASGTGDVTLDLHGPVGAVPRASAPRPRGSRLAECARAVAACRAGARPSGWSLETPWPLEVRLAARPGLEALPPASARREAA
jgi:hypothetical protein